MPTVKSTPRPWIVKRKAEPQQGRKEANRDVYSSWRWTKLSRLYREANPLCVTCLESKAYTPSKVVDHVVPINHPSKPDPWDESNWQSLCLSCHQSKSAKERNS